MLELKLDQIEVHFGNHHVLKGLNATFDAGKIHSVIGINGAGKSKKPELEGFERNYSGSK